MPLENENLKQTDKKQVGMHERQLVIFKIAEEEFGVDINKVKEIIRWEDVTRIPNTASHIKGVINLRGNIIVVNDLAMKLGLPSKPVDDDTRILVVEVAKNTIGMIVDSATEVMRLSGEKIREAPSMITTNINHNYIEGVGLLNEKRLLTLLDLAKVLESTEYEQILKVQKTAEENIKKDITTNEKSSSETNTSSPSTIKEHQPTKKVEISIPTLN
ncbi:MAG: chemotaxis protein CheW [Euryarchaeota archaeon]|nr:chemotaxis protein CheW [Euryarchaeota archaeon]